MAKKKLNHHLYQDNNSGIWYFQKKVRGVSKPYKLSLETVSVVEARRKRDELLKEIEYHGSIPTTKPDIPNEGKLFGEVAQLWAKIKKTKIGETTFDGYRKVMNFHILPKFGNMPIKSITGLDIENFISELKCDGKTKSNILTPFRGVMNFAKKYHFVDANPFVDVEPIKKSKKTSTRALTLSEIDQFINELDKFWKPLFIFLFFSGVRIAEATALKWKQVDLRKRTISVQNNLVRGKGGKIIYKDPKNESSIRDIIMPDFVIEALHEQRKRTWKENGDNYIFLNRRGRPVHRHTLNNGVIKKTLNKIGIDTHISIKDTRASFITNALDKRERMSFIQKHVGHTTTRMIVDHYYRHVSAPDDGTHLEKAWKSVSASTPMDRETLDT